MSRSQGAANGGWQAQRHPAAEPDPRSGGRPAQRQQAPQYPAPPQHAAPYPQPGYDEQQAAAGYPAQQAYHYPQQHPQQAQPQQPQYAPPAAPPINRQGLSSLDSARNAQPTHDFDNYPRTQPPQYTHPPQRAQAPRPAYAPPPTDNPIHAATGYRQPAQAAAYPAPQYGSPPGYEQWPAQDPYAPQDLNGYLPGDAPFPANSNQPYGDPLQQADWAMPAAGYGDPALDQHNGYGRGQLGYEQPQHGGALEPTYNSAEAGYEGEEPRRSSWTMRIAGAIVVAIGLGYGLAQAYKAVLGSPTDAPPPVIASDASPAREKPAEPGGRQFAHPDSKVLGRLSDGDQASADTSSDSLSESDTTSGARQVKTLVVGRDGSIAPPESGPEPEPTVSVPGLTVVDAFGGAPMPQHSAPPEPPRQAPEPAEPPKARVNVKSTKVIPSSTASLPEEEVAAVAVPKKPKAAAPAATDEGATSPTGANGYVVVLASVPASGNSRLDALRKFADLQQQYGTVLSNRTPDVRETTLAGKGAYHRLLVGPPGSRSQASELCMQLKASGYKDCWVTAY